MNKLVIIFTFSLFMAYSCKKDDKIVRDVPVSSSVVSSPAWNEQFIGVYSGEMTYRSFNLSLPPEPWTTKDSTIVIGQYAGYPEYNTTSLQDIPSIHFTTVNGFSGSPSGPLKIFEFDGDSLHYHGKTANGAGLEIEFRGKRTH